MVLGAEIIRFINALECEKDIDREVLFQALEGALIAAIRKKYGIEDDFELTIDRDTGEVDSEVELDLADLGRIAATTAKQVLHQKLKEAEQDVVFDDFESRVGTIGNGTVQRFEGDTVIISIGKVEGILPRRERIRGENYHVGDRVRCLVQEVVKEGTKVKVILSRNSPDLVRRLFELEVPEISDGIIEVQAVEREGGYRTKIGVLSHDPKIDSVGACVGVRCTRIKSIIDELNGEKIDVIPWDSDPETLIVNTLKPASIVSITLDQDTRKALVIVNEDQLSLAIGQRGQNVRLASKLSGWDIDIMTQHELEEATEGPEGEDAGDEEPQGSETDHPALEGEQERQAD
jgi:transcription termination/antitermination protein NusA